VTGEHEQRLGGEGIRLGPDLGDLGRYWAFSSFPTTNLLFFLFLLSIYACISAESAPSGEITILREALFKRVQWSRGCIVVSPKVLSSQRSPRPPLPGHGSAKSNLKDLVVANVSSSQDGTAKSATVEDKSTKSSHATTTCLSAPRKSKSDTE